MNYTKWHELCHGSSAQLIPVPKTIAKLDSFLVPGDEVNEWESTDRSMDMSASFLIEIDNDLEYFKKDYQKRVDDHSIYMMQIKGAHPQEKNRINQEIKEVRNLIRKILSYDYFFYCLFLHEKYLYTLLKRHSSGEEATKEFRELSVIQTQIEQHQGLDHNLSTIFLRKRGIDNLVKIEELTKKINHQVSVLLTRGKAKPENTTKKDKILKKGTAISPTEAIACDIHPDKKEEGDIGLKIDKALQRITHLHQGVGVSTPQEMQGLKIKIELGYTLGLMKTEEYTQYLQKIEEIESRSYIAEPSINTKEIPVKKDESPRGSLKNQKDYQELRNYGENVIRIAQSKISNTKGNGGIRNSAADGCISNNALRPFFYWLINTYIEHRTQELPDAIYPVDANEITDFYRKTVADHSNKYRKWLIDEFSNRGKLSSTKDFHNAITTTIKNISKGAHFTNKGQIACQKILLELSKIHI